MEYITVRQTNLTNSNGNDMGKVSAGVHYLMVTKNTKMINGINRLLVETNRYIPLVDVLLVIDPPPPQVTKEIVQIRLGDMYPDNTIIWRPGPKSYEEI
jgi:hypothetical protein